VSGRCGQTQLPEISKTIPLIDMVYRRFLTFVYRCLSSRSFVVNFIARHSILFCCKNSIVGCNVLSCCQRYSTNIDSVRTYRFNIKDINRIDDCNRVPMLNGLFQCRDGKLCLYDDPVAMMLNN